MATTATILVNYVDADVTYATTAADYIAMDLSNDYIIWTAGDTTVKDLMTAEPTVSQLNAAASVISSTVDVTVGLCLMYDYSHNVGGSIYTHKVIGMGENKRYVFCVSFDGDTATEPQLECWDTDAHASTSNHVLGNGTPANSMVKAVCTTDALPGASWAGAPLAGSSNVLLLNAGNGALNDLASGETSQELYWNMKIVIPAAYATPEACTFVSTVRYTWN